MQRFLRTIIKRKLRNQKKIGKLSLIKLKNIYSSKNIKKIIRPQIGENIWKTNTRKKDLYLDYIKNSYNSKRHLNLKVDKNLNSYFSKEDT